jgi:hypothetical protein
MSDAYQFTRSVNTFAMGGEIAAAAAVATLGFAAPASSAVYLVSTPAGATAGGQPISAQAQFTSSRNQISPVLQANPTSIIQAISDLPALPPPARSN